MSSLRLRAEARLPTSYPSSDVPRRPRVVVLITLAEVGGAQAYVAALLPVLAEHFDVTVAARGDGPVRDAARALGLRFVGLRHLRRPIRPWRDLLALAELVRLLRRERPDVLHASSSKAGVLGRLAAFLVGVPIRIFTVHGWAFAATPGRASSLYRLADRIMRPLTTATICVSENELAAGIAARTCDPERTVVIHNAVDVAGATRARHERRRPKIISVGRLNAPKDTATLLRALAVLPADGFQALIVGDGPELPALEGLVGQLGLDGRVRLEGERHDVAELLAGADVFVLSSRSEGLPVSVLEAMAAGLPVVASDVGGVSELVVDGETGVLVRPGDADELAGVLDDLIGDPDRRRILGHAGRERAERLFDLEEFKRAHLELYHREQERNGAGSRGVGSF